MNDRRNDRLKVAGCGSNARIAAGRAKRARPSLRRPRRTST
jgi:hypothetical protein